MVILEVHFDRKGMSAAMLPAMDRAERAQPFVALPGLQWKIWLNSEGGPGLGGIYCFDSRASAEAYLAGPIVAALRANPEVTNLTTRIYAITEQPSRATRAPVAFATRAAE